MGVKDAVKQVLTKQLNMRYKKQLARRKISYDKWVREREAACASRTEPVALQQDTEGEGLAGASRCSCNDFILLVQKEGTISSGAMGEISAYFMDHPEVELLYGDEDLMLPDGRRVNPWYKPCWSPDLYNTYFYLGSVIAVRKELYDRVRKKTVDKSNECAVGEAGKNPYGCGKDPENGCIEFTDAGEIQELVSQLVRSAGGFRRGCNTIGHVEYVLFHGESDRIWEAYQSLPGILYREKEAEGAEQTVPSKSAIKQEQTVKAPKTVSIIIPSKDNPQILNSCLGSLRLEKHPNVEVLIVDNGSSEENQRTIAAVIDRIPGKIRYLCQPMEFNFSHMCNMGAGQAAGDFLLFLNDDMEMCDNDWLEVMLDKAKKEYVGAVGLKLYYPDSVRIQHAGIVNLPVGPVHKLQFMEDDRDYYFGRNRGCINCVAVTGACLMIEKTKFAEAGGFEERLRVAYNDVELGFSLLELGYQNVVINDRYGWHHESLSRGNDETREKLLRLEQERELLYELHPDFRGEDPYYPAGLNRQGLDSRVVPGYVTSKNTLQKSRFTAFSKRQPKLRWDNCLMARVESSGPDMIQGYSVVLGDDNACYDKYLVLLPMKQGMAAAERRKTIEGAAESRESGEGVTVSGRAIESAADRCWYMKLEGQYRQDLEENIPDQVNVALGGFCVSRRDECLPKGGYSIAVMAVNRITGLRLINESGKYLTVE